MQFQDGTGPSEAAEIQIVAADAADVQAVTELLRGQGLSSDGVETRIGTFVAAWDADGRLVGCGGAEAYQFAALIRGVAVEPDHQRGGLGRRIVRELLDRLASRGLREFYLVSPPAAERFFRKRGFRPIERYEVHPQILSSTEVTNAADDAVFMRLVMH